jgi:integrase
VGTSYPVVYRVIQDPAAMRHLGIPSLRRHKPSSQAVVTLSGKDYYLGVWPAHARRPAAAVRQAYEALIAEWLAGGRVVGCEPFTVRALILRFLEHAQVHYRRADGSVTHEVNHFKQAFRDLRRLFGHLPASDFSPLKLKALRDEWIKAGYARTYVNQRVGRVKRLFKFGVAEEVVPAPVFHALQTVGGLQRGRTPARETDAIKPVGAQVVDETIPRLGRRVAAMVRLQVLTGMRSGEVVRMRACDIDRSGDVWLYRPPGHKMSHRGRERVIPLGPQAQSVLKPYLSGRTPDAYLFDPREARAEQDAARRAKRPTQTAGGRKPRQVACPKVQPRAHYTPDSYGRAIARACKVAGVPHWHPHQLRHLFGTSVRQEFGLEPAQVLLGHSNARVTEVYAERDLKRASDIAARIG